VRRFAIMIALSLPGAGASNPEDARPSVPLVSFESLQGRLGHPDLRLLDARPRADYDKGHIPGAVWVDVKAAEALAAGPGGLTDRGAWEAWIAPLGIKPGVDVLVYDASRQLDAARLWWLLGYLGVEAAGLVDGGFPLWESQGRPVSTEPAAAAPLPFRVVFRADRHATRGEVLSAIRGGPGSARVVDARSLAENLGTERRSKKAGHIPTACHLEWVNLVDADGRFLDVPAIREKLARAGIAPGTPVITHCQGGGRASVNAFVFERLGFPTRNYYLGWSDWGNADETPVAAGDTSPSP